VVQEINYKCAREFKAETTASGIIERGPEMCCGTNLYSPGDKTCSPLKSSHLVDLRFSDTDEFDDAG